MPLWVDETAPEVQKLRTLLDNFYNAIGKGYSEFFEKTSSHPEYWDIVMDRVCAKLVAQNMIKPECKILEFGAGRTGFGNALGTLRDRVYLAVQDVTKQNKKYLSSIADRVYLGDLGEVNETFDIIFSTFVWEHVTNPRATLEKLLDILVPGGSIFLFCPRYDWPGYVPPVLRHHGKLYGFLISFWLPLSRLMHGIFGKNGNFWIVKEPAVFSVDKWYRDSDAVHLVSRADVRAYFRHRSEVVTDCWPRKASFSAGLLERCLRLCVEIKKT